MVSIFIRQFTKFTSFKPNINFDFLNVKKYANIVSNTNNISYRFVVPIILGNYALALVTDDSGKTGNINQA